MAYVSEMGMADVRKRHSHMRVSVHHGGDCKASYIPALMQVPFRDGATATLKVGKSNDAHRPIPEEITQRRIGQSSRVPLYFTYIPPPSQC
jgi:hypothetical protein